MPKALVQGNTRLSAPYTITSLESFQAMEDFPTMNKLLQGLQGNTRLSALYTSTSLENFQVMEDFPSMNKLPTQKKSS